MSDTNDIAARIVAAVKERGYWPDDWPAWVIAARQSVKLFEEVAEASECLGDARPWEIENLAPDVQRHARQCFRDVDYWQAIARYPELAQQVNWAAKRDELVDVLVVLRVAFAAIAVHTGEPFDADAAAVAKAEADVKRGTA